MQLRTRKTIQFTALHEKCATERSTAVQVFAALTSNVTYVSFNKHFNIT